MKDEHSTDSRSPWPACTDCQIAEPQHATTDAQSPERAATDTERGIEDAFGAIEPTAELGPRAAEVRAQVAAALQRARERATQAKNTEQ